MTFGKRYHTHVCPNCKEPVTCPDTDNHNPLCGTEAFKNHKCGGKSAA